MIRLFVLLIAFALVLCANVKYDIFITSYTKDKLELAKQYKEVLKEYLALQNINQKVSLEQTTDSIIIKIVNFNTIDEAKEIRLKIKDDFKDSFIQERKLDNLNEIHKNAMKLLKEEKAEEAYELLLKPYQNNSYDKQTLFLLGSSAKQKGDIKTAIIYFEELLALDQNAHRVRLELASLYYEDKQYEKANEQFLIVKSAKIPKQVESNIDRFKIKQQIKNQKNYNLSASLGYMKDSNVNLGPTIDTVSLYGVDFTLSSDAKETDDTAITLRANGDLYNQFNSFVLKSSLGVSKVDYSDQNTYDTSVYSISTSPMLLRGDTLYSVPITFSNIDIGSSEDYYLRNLAIAPTLKKPLSDSIIYSIKLNLEKKKYKSIPTKDGLTYGLEYGLEFLDKKTSTINFKTYFNKNDSDDDIYSYKNIGATLSYTDVIYPRVFFVGNFNYETSSYDKAEDAFTTKKDEHNLNGSFNFIYDLNYYNSNVMFSYFKQRNSSNIDLYTYDRSQASISFNIRY